MKVRKIISPIGSVISQRSLIRLTGREMIFPFYHAISDKDLPYISNLYPLRSVRQFERDLEVLCKTFEPVDLDEIYRRIDSGSALGKPVFHLTFDDGLTEIYDVVVSILERKGIPATFFINTGFVDNKNLFYRYKVGLIIERMKGDGVQHFSELVEQCLRGKSKWKGTMRSSLMALTYNDGVVVDEIVSLVELEVDSWLEKHKPYMSSDQIKELLHKGYKIGSHSVDHPRFEDIGLEDQKAQIARSFAMLKDMFGIDERLFSFPFGDHGVGLALFDWMYGDGKCRMSFGVSGLKDDYCAHHIHRVPMDMCAGDPEQFIKSEYLYFVLKSVFKKNKIRRQ